MRALVIALALSASTLVPAAQAEPSPLVVVPLASGRVEVQRSPFRMTLRDASGREALSEVAPDGLPPTAVAPDPHPLGSTTVRVPSRYSPLTFTVGTASTVQEPAAQFAGDVLVNAAAGVQYAATAVQAVTSLAGGVRLTVATDDPTGRTLAVTITEQRGGTAHISVRPSSSTGIAVVADSFSSGKDEAFHGFGGRHNGLDQHGQDLLCFLEQENVSAGALSPVAGATPGSGGDAYQFPGGPGATYSSSPSFISSRPYGFALDRDEISRLRLDSDRPDAWQAGVAAGALDYTVALGSGPQTVAALTARSGRHRVPPAWALGSLFDREVTFPTAESGDVYYAEILDDLRHFDSDHLPVDGYRIEGWPLLTTAQLKDVLARLHRRHIHALLYFRAFSGPDSAGTEPKNVYDEAIAGGYFARTATGQPYLFLDNFGSQAGLVDFSNPAAVRWFQGRLTAAMTVGADGFMTDFGEQVLTDMHFADGSTGAQMHNHYPVLYQRAVRQAVDRFESSHPGRQIWFFNRAGWTGGQPGSAAYESANFPGDEATDWSHASGLGAQASDMLNRAVAGQYGYTTDIGGYFDVVTPATTPELFLRWAAWAALSPSFRLHGSVLNGEHTPWSYGPQVEAAYRRLALLHKAAGPLMASLWKQADKTGLPPLRPLWLAEPGDPTAAVQDQEWLLGNDVLVAPVVTQGALTHAVYLPSGRWVDQQSGKTYEGRRTVTVASPVGGLPYFFRAGTQPFRPPSDTPRAGRPSGTTALAATGNVSPTLLLLGLLMLTTAGLTRRAAQRRPQSWHRPGRATCTPGAPPARLAMRMPGTGTRTTATPATSAPTPDRPPPSRG
jgi:alpha-glucosidase